MFKAPAEPRTLPPHDRDVGLPGSWVAVVALVVVTAVLALAAVTS